MGASDKKTTTDSTQNSSQAFSNTTTPNVPSWISDPAQSMAGQVGGVLGQGASAFTPTTSALQQQTFNQAQNFTPASNYADASSAWGNLPQVTGQSALTGLSDYYSPFQSQVTDPLLASYDKQAGMTTAAQAAQAAGAGRAFQGSRYGVQEGETAADLALGRSNVLGGALSQMYGTALSASQQDAQRRQDAMASNQSAAEAAASGMTGIDTAQNQQQLQEQQAQAALGAQATDAQQMQQQYPLTFLAQNESLLSGLNPALYTGSSSSGTGSGTSTTNSTQTVSDPMGQIAGLMAAGGALAGGLTGTGGAASGAGSLFKFFH